jgi:hypothetical protein
MANAAEPKRKRGGAYNFPKYRGEKRIVAALQQHGPMTARQLSPLVFLGHEGMSKYMRHLKKGVPGLPRVRIAAWEPPVGAGPHIPLYGIGDAPDAKIVRVGRYAPDRKRKNRHAARHALVLELATNGPMNIHEMAAFSGLTISGVGRFVRLMREGVVPLQRMRVCGYDRVGHRSQQTPRFTLGNGFDVKRVLLTPRERHARHFQKYHAVIEARRLGVYAGPFDALLRAVA